MKKIYSLKKSNIYEIEIMWNYVISSMCTLYFIPFGFSVPHPINTPLDVLKQQAEYEKNHRDMLATGAELQTWPMLNDEIQMCICEKYINKLFVKKERTVKSTYNISVRINYPELYKSSNITDQVAALKCEISPPASGRKYLLFIRSPRNDCLYLINQWLTSPHDFYITKEICELGEYSYWHIRRLKYNPITKNSFQQTWKSDEECKLKEYETNHLKDYLLRTNEYLSWPEFRTESAQDLCRELLWEIYPKEKNYTLRGSDEKIKLQYNKITKTYAIISNMKVSAVKCYSPQAGYRKYFRFIKAPNQMCVYLIKHITSRKYMFYIAKLFCKYSEASQSGGQLDLEYNERKYEPTYEFHEIKKESKYENELGIDCNEDDEKDPSIINNTFHHFI